MLGSQLRINMAITVTTGEYKVQYEFRWRLSTEEDKFVLKADDTDNFGDEYSLFVVLQVRYLEHPIEDNGPFTGSCVGARMGEWQDVEVMSERD